MANKGSLAGIVALNARTKERMDIVAEHVENGNSVVSAAPLVGLTRGGVLSLWRRIRDGLGWQAV